MATSTEFCPVCFGVSGYHFLLTESHAMRGDWGGDATAGDSGINVRRSLVECLDCGAKFRHDSLLDKGLIA